VALSGDGGDENFAGYDNYAQVAAWSKADVIPSGIRRVAGRAVAATLEALPYSTTTARASRAAAMAASEVPQRFRLQSSIFKPQEKAAAYTAQFHSLLEGNPPSPVRLPWSADMDGIDWMMRHDQSFYLADCLMVKVDIAAMANSLEVRAPLLDHKFVEFTATIPSAMKFDGAGGKRIFKRAMRDLVPAAILDKKKRGFSVPLARWFRGELAPLLRATLLDERAARRGLFVPKFVRRMIDEHAAGARDWSSRLWSLLFLELWFREWID